jgi:hypothetical protein
MGAGNAWENSISFTSASAELAAMIVESEAESAERTDQALEATKERIERAADAEYEARMNAASDSALAAVLSGAFTIAGGAARIGAGVADARALEDATQTGKPEAATRSTTGSMLGPTGAALSELAPVAKQLGGEISAERQRARAERIGRSIAQASVEADQLAQQVQRREQRESSALDAARGFIDAETARSSAVLSRG